MVRGTINPRQHHLVWILILGVKTVLPLIDYQENYKNGEINLFWIYSKNTFRNVVVGIEQVEWWKSDRFVLYVQATSDYNTYSVDGRWDIITGTYTSVAADVVAMDSPLPLKKERFVK